MVINITRAWLVGSCHAKLTVTPYTVCVSDTRNVSHASTMDTDAQHLSWQHCRSGSEWASGAQRVQHCAGAVVPDPFVCFARPPLPGGALLFTLKPALFVESGVVGSRQVARSSGSVYLFEGASQCEGTEGGCMLLH